MKKKVNPIQEIRNYFYNIYTHGECCNNDSMNCLNAYWQYIKYINDFDDDWCETQIHLTKILNQYSSATLETDDDYHFHVNLPKELSRIYELRDMDNIVRLFIVAGHEFQHIIQTFIYPTVMEDYMIFLSRSETNSIKFSNEGAVNNKKFRQLKNGYLFDAEFLSQLEKDADKKTHDYFNETINEIISQEDDEKFISFLRTLIDYSDVINKIRKKDYQLTQNHYNQLVRILTRLYNIKKDELIIP